MYSRMSPSRPISIASGMSSGLPAGMVRGGDRTVTSTVTEPSSPSVRSGNLGSWQAERPARTMASLSGMTGSGMPMHPLRSPLGNVLSVTNAPALPSNRGSETSIDLPPLTSASTAERARATASSPKGKLTPRSS